jgi:hypothetical protein
MGRQCRHDGGRLCGCDHIDVEGNGLAVLLHIAVPLASDRLGHATVAREADARIVIVAELPRVLLRKRIAIRAEDAEVLVDLVA